LKGARPVENEDDNGMIPGENACYLCMVMFTNADAPAHRTHVLEVDGDPEYFHPECARKVRARAELDVLSFEDAVIFVYDVERVLGRLRPFAQLVIGTIIFQEYNQDEAAEQLRCARRTICREFPEAVDRISELFLEGGLLNRLPVEVGLGQQQDGIGRHGMHQLPGRLQQSNRLRSKTHARLRQIIQGKKPALPS
jgi:hypothetical protein